MLFGVPMLPIFCVVATLLMTAAIASAVTRKGMPYIIAIITAFPIIGVMRLMVKHDEDKFKLIGMWIVSRLKERNYFHWKALSYGSFDAKKGIRKK
jgi:type IV secretory pathway VirB3-like protein